MGVRRRRRGGDESLCRPAAKALSATAAQDDRSHAVIWPSGQATRLSSIHRSRRGYLGAISPASALRPAHSQATRLCLLWPLQSLWLPCECEGLYASHGYSGCAANGQLGSADKL